MTDESSDHELPIDEFTVPELRVAVALQRKEIDRLKARVEAARNAMIAYANANSKHVYNGVEQDPNGVHAWLDVKLPGGE